MKKRYKIKLPDIFFRMFLPEYANLCDLPRKKKKSAKKFVQKLLEGMLNDEGSKLNEAIRKL